MGGSAPQIPPPGDFNPLDPNYLGSKGRRPLVGIKRGNAPLSLFLVVAEKADQGRVVEAARALFLKPRQVPLD